MDYLLPAVLIPLSFFALIAFLTWTFVSARNHRIASEHKAKLQERMLERFSLAAEFAEFLHTPEGSKYLSTFTEAPTGNPIHKTLDSVRAGLVIAMTAIGLIVAGYASGYEHDGGTLAIGLLGLFLGLGFLMSAVATYGLGRKWGMIGDDRRPSGE